MATCTQEQLAAFIATYDAPIKRALRTQAKLTWQVPLQQPGLRMGEGTYQLNNGEGEYIALFSIEQLRGCCGVCVSTGAHVSMPYRRLGLGTLLNEMRLGMAKRLGYGVMLCTDVITNGPERKLLAKNGWKDVHKFRNPRTGRQVAISVRSLADIDISDCPNVAAGWPEEQLAEAAR